ncbi:MAG: prepilin peptidase [Bdellovibrionales bacterium]|nr:prepilin peptidase [Bdellovibrionales bacterium]
MENLLTLFTAFFGLLVGSFLNALIYRIPRRINIAFPRSSCTQCEKIIYWYENIPILSYLFLKGKCSGCREPISPEYPIIELVTAIFAYFFAPKNLESSTLLNFIFFFSAFCAFLSHLVIDLKHQVLPDSINIYLALLFFMATFMSRPWIFWVSGGLLGFGFPLLVSWIFYQLKGQVGLGGGDIKLFGALGIYLGPIGIMQNIFLSCLLGATVGIVLMSFKIIKKENPIPFGPFIIIVASFQIFTESWFNHLISYIP